MQAIKVESVIKANNGSTWKCITVSYLVTHSLALSSYFHHHHHHNTNIFGWYHMRAVNLMTRPQLDISNISNILDNPHSSIWDVIFKPYHKQG